MESHLLQMRGLKLRVLVKSDAGQWVASFTDAWIETIMKEMQLDDKVCRIFYRCVD